MTTAAQQCVVAVYQDFAQARKAIQVLERSDIPREQVSLVTHDVPRQVQDVEPIQYGDETESRAREGAGVGGLIGLLVGAPLVLVPGIGPVLWAGPLAMGLTGAIVGGFLGAMGGWGVHKDHVREYEEHVREGRFLIVVSGPADEVAEAARLLGNTEPMSINVHAATGDDSPEIDDRP